MRLYGNQDTIVLEAARIHNAYHWNAAFYQTVVLQSSASSSAFGAKPLAAAADIGAGGLAGTSVLRLDFPSFLFLLRAGLRSVVGPAATSVTWWLQLISNLPPVTQMLLQIACSVSSWVKTVVTCTSCGIHGADETVKPSLLDVYVSFSTGFMYEACHFNYADLFVVVAMVRICDSFFSSVPSFCYSHCVCVFIVCFCFVLILFLYNTWCKLFW